MPLSILSSRGLVTVVLLTTLAAPAAAQTYSWVGLANGSWSVATNWSPGTVPTAIGDVARLDGAADSPIVNGTFTIGRLTFDSATVFSHTVNSGGAGTGLVLNNGAADGLVEVVPNVNGSGSGTVNAPLAIAGTNALNLVAPTLTSTLNVGGPITGAGAVVNVNPGGQTGSVNLTAANAYGGAGSVTTFGGGRVGATDGVGVPTDTALALSGAVWQSLADSTVTRALGTGLGQLRVAGASGFQAGNGTTFRLRLGNGTGVVTWGDPAFNPTTLTLGGVGSGGVVFENALDLNGATRTISGTGTATITGAVGSTTGTAGLTKTGLGLLVLTGANTYTGPTTVNGGVLRANDGAGLPAGSNLNLQFGAFESLGSATFSRDLGTGPGQVQFTNSGGALSARGGTLTVQLNGGTGTVGWGDTGFVGGAGGTLRFGSEAFDGVVDFRNGLDLAGGTRQVTLTAPTTGKVGVARLSGVIANGASTTGATNGTIELAAANTYTGQTTVSGTLRAADGVGLPAASNLLLSSGVFEGLGPTTFTRTVGTGAGQVQFGFSGGFSAFDGPTVVQLNNGTGTVTWTDLGAGLFRLDFGSRTSNALTDFQNGLNLGVPNRNFGVSDNPATAADRTRISGVISNGGVSLVGFGGTLELSAANTYTGATVLQAGALRAVDGVGLPTASVLIFNGGVFEGAGAGSFTRLLGGTGSGRVQFVGAGGFAASDGVLEVRINNLTRELTWGQTNFISGSASLRFGSATADNLADFQNGLDLAGGFRAILPIGNPGYAGPVGRLSGEISNGGLNIGQVGQANPGVLEVTAANTYTLGTTVASGKLLVNNAAGSGTGTGFVRIGVFGAAAAVGGSGRITATGANNVVVIGGSRIEPGGGADTNLRVETAGGGIFIGVGDPRPATWAVRVTAAGPGGVAANSGGSTVGTTPNPTNHTFLELSGGGPGTVTIAPNTVFEVDGTGVAFVPGVLYSYKIGEVGAGELSGGPLNVTGAGNFATVGFQATGFSLTSDASGVIYLNFIPVPEPRLLLTIAASLGLAAFARGFPRVRPAHQIRGG